MSDEKETPTASTSHRRRKSTRVPIPSPVGISLASTTSSSPGEVGNLLLDNSDDSRKRKWHSPVWEHYDIFEGNRFEDGIPRAICKYCKSGPLVASCFTQSKNALLSTFLFLDQIVPLARSGIYKNKERADRLGRISLYCWMSASVCTTLIELGELGRLSSQMKRLEKELKDTDKHKGEQYRAKLSKSNERSLALIKAVADFVVAIGLLQLAPKKITSRVLGAVGVGSSLISCYQAKENGFEDSVMTIEELRSGVESRGTELSGIDRTILMRALKLLESKGKLAIFKGTSTDDEGVKFSI